jgi:hypothetical protein
MNMGRAVGWELRRILLTRTYLYSVLLILLFSHNALGRLVIHGTYGTAPYSPLSYASFLTLLNPILLSVLMLWCAAVFSERERAVRRISLSTPVSNVGYMAMKAAAIAAAFAITAGLMVAASFAFYIRQFGLHDFQAFLHPLVLFLLAPSVFVLGLSMAAGQLHRRLPHLLVPVLFFAGVMYLGLPPWLDLCANNFLTAYPKILMRTLGTGEMVYHLPSGFVASRVGLVLGGLALLAWSARRPFH